MEGTTQEILNSLDLELGRCTRQKVQAYVRSAKQNEATKERLIEALLSAGCVKAEIVIVSSIESALLDSLINF